VPRQHRDVEPFQWLHLPYPESWRAMRRSIVLR
jgi:hypothetical protein